MSLDAFKRASTAWGQAERAAAATGAHRCDACGQLAAVLHALPNGDEPAWLVCAGCLAADEAGCADTDEPVPPDLQAVCGTTGPGLGWPASVHVKPPPLSETQACGRRGEGGATTLPARGYRAADDRLSAAPGAASAGGEKANHYAPSPLCAHCPLTGGRKT